MAIRVRRGLKADFDPNKLVEGELATPLDTRELYAAFAPGDVQKIATNENVHEMVEEVTEDIIIEITESVNNATEYATEQGDYAKDKGEYASDQGDYAKNQGDYAKQQGDNIGSIVTGSMATDTTVGVVKGGGNIEISQDGEMNYDMTGDTKDNTATFTEATADTDITSGETHATLFGKILKSIKTLRYNIGVLTTEKIDKSAIVNQDAINDVNKVPSSAVTYAHGQAITQLNNNLDIVKARAFYRYPVSYGDNVNTVVGEEKHIFIINTVNTPSAHGFLDCSYFSGEGFAPGGIGAEPITLQTWHDYNTGISSNRTYNHNIGVFSPWT